jgi:tetratricopeptide (TPR) repeat protein
MAKELFFLQVPESLRGQIETGPISGAEGEDFSIDPAIPLPVELAQGETRPDLERLSWEMLLSGMIRVIADDPAGAHTDYYRRFVLAVRPDILQEFTGAAIIKARNGDYDLALEILESLEGLFPGAEAVILNRALIREERAELRAEALERAGREAEAETLHEQARAAWEEALALRPVPPGALFNGGFFFMKRRDFNRARECFRAYLPRAENDEKRDQARALIREIEQGGLDDELFREASALIRTGEPETGLLRIRDFLERHPGVWNGWFILGWGLRRLGRWAEGAASFRKALDLGGNTSDTHNELAICLTELGDLAAARRELETALREDPENIKIISNLGALALKQGNREEAAGFFRTVLELDPEDPLARELLGPPPSP